MRQKREKEKLIFPPLFFSISFLFWVQGQYKNWRARQKREKEKAFYQKVKVDCIFVVTFVRSFIPLPTAKTKIFQLQAQVDWPQGGEPGGVSFFFFEQLFS